MDNIYKIDFDFKKGRKHWDEHHHFIWTAYNARTAREFFDEMMSKKTSRHPFHVTVKRVNDWIGEIGYFDSPNGSGIGKSYPV